MGVPDLAITRETNKQKTSGTFFEGLGKCVLQIRTKFEKFGRASLNYRFMYFSVSPACTYLLSTDKEDHNRFGTLEVMRDATDAEWDC